MLEKSSGSNYSSRPDREEWRLEATEFLHQLILGCKRKNIKDDLKTFV
jgi:hypothetical protein